MVWSKERMFPSAWLAAAALAIPAAVALSGRSYAGHDLVPSYLSQMEAYRLVPGRGFDNDGEPTSRP